MQPVHTLNDPNLRLYYRGALPATAPLLLTFLQPHEADAVASLLKADVVLMSLDRTDWEHAFSPWPAPRAFKKAPDFSGGATETLTSLAARLPAIEQRLGLQPRWRGIAGYSLAGLFAAWSAYHASPFSRVVCVSGSLWFDGWADFATSRLLQTPPARAYFSLGDSEKNSRNPRLATVENMTRATAQYWRQQGIHTVFGLNPDGHFDDIAARTAAAINQLAAAD